MRTYFLIILNLTSMILFSVSLLSTYIHPKIQGAILSLLTHVFSCMLPLCVLTKLHSSLYMLYLNFHTICKQDYVRVHDQIQMLSGTGNLVNSHPFFFVSNYSLEYLKIPLSSNSLLGNNVVKLLFCSFFFYHISYFVPSMSYFDPS